jgi:hypothetical protein
MPFLSENPDSALLFHAVFTGESPDIVLFILIIRESR